MTLSEIFTQLPASVAVHLEKLLTEAPITLYPTKEEVHEAARWIAIELGAHVVSNGDEQVLNILTHLPGAVVDQLF